MGHDTIEDIKHKVEEKMWIAPHKQKLICDEIYLLGLSTRKFVGVKVTHDPVKLNMC